MTDLREAIARAICVADGYDPDEDAVAGQAAAFENFGPRWQANHRAQGTLGGADYVEMADAVLAILPDAEALAKALERRDAKAPECPIDRPRCVSKPPETCPRCFAKRNDICFAKHYVDYRFVSEARAALAAYRKGTGREG